MTSPAPPSADGAHPSTTGAQCDGAPAQAALRRGVACVGQWLPFAVVAIYAGLVAWLFIP